MIDGSVLITGGDQPFGAAIVDRLSEAADEIIIGGADEEQLTEVADRFDSEGIHPVRADPRDEFDIERLAETASRHGDDPLDLVIPAARVSHGDADAPVIETSYAAFDDEQRTNIRGVFATVREVAPHCDETTRILVPITDSREVPGTFAAGEAAIKQLVTTIAESTDLPIATVNIASAIEAGEFDPDRAAGSVVVGATRDIEAYDGRTFESDD